MKDYFIDFIEGSTNQEIAVDILEASHAFSATLNRHFIPCFTTKEDSLGIGFADIHHTYHKPTATHCIVSTYERYRDVYQIDLLKIPRIKKYLSAIIKE